MPPPLTTAASRVPSAEEAMDCQFLKGKLEMPQPLPPSVEVQIRSPYATNASRAPSAEEAMEDQAEEPGPPGDHVSPPSAEKYTKPVRVTATSRKPSAEEATEDQAPTTSGKLSSVQVAPEFVEVCPLPVFTAVKRTPSAEEAMAVQVPVIALVCVHRLPPLVEV